MSKKKLIVVLAVVMFCCCGAPLYVMGAAVTELWSTAGQDFSQQCDNVVGPVAGTTPTTAAPTSAASVPTEPASAEPAITANPYASLTFAADDPDAGPRERECASAVRVTPQNGPALQRPSSGPVAACAADLALDYPEAGGAADAATYIRDVIYSASVAASLERCVPGRTPHGAAEENCGDTGDGEPVVLPETVREQAFCGQAVERTAISAGDLVFWDYRDYAPTRAGIARGPDELVTVEGGKFVRSGIPGAGHVRIKRVLREVS